VGSPLASRKLSTIRKKLAELRRDLNGFKGSPEAFKQLQEAEENLQEATDALAGVIHFFSSVRTPQLSPDGKLGGRGYVRDIREMMGDLKEALSSASSALDTVSDERNNNPSWEDVLAGEEEEFNKESVKDYENELEKEGHVSVGETLVFDFSHPDNRDEEATSQGGAFFKGSPALGGDPIVE
jgi:DNA repair exonuclease SbcCD ATPase subunit